jgi:hypothetical protein
VSVNEIMSKNMGDMYNRILFRSKKM